tara:strand:+ start:982 stop:1950 length:969 start_codon:yes stop_codon:yes gene_type:complete
VSFEFNKRFDALFWRWAKRRTSAQKTVTLKHRAIYVLPSKAGVCFFVAVILLWLLGTNYENNLVLAASFFLVSLFIVAIIHGFRNLAGLQLTALPARPVFAGEPLELSVRLKARAGTTSGRVSLAADVNRAVVTDVAKDTEEQLALRLATQGRGWFTPERILVQSYYPLGLLRTWSWVRFDVRLLVYPKPLACAQPATIGRDDGERSATQLQGDDFDGFKRYQPGAPLTHIAWKLYARGAGLHIKQYASAELDSVWLDFRAVSGDREARLSALCYLALQWHQAGRTFGLRLLEQQIEPASGQEHLHRVLQALALFELEQEPL